MSSIGRMLVVGESGLRFAIHVRTPLKMLCDIFHCDEDQQGRYIDFSNEDEIVDEAMVNEASPNLRGSHMSQHCSLFSLARYSALCNV